MMLAQIEIMQLQIRQFIIARIHYCDHDLKILGDQHQDAKRRVIGKKKKLYMNDLKNHMDSIFREHKRNQLLNKSAVLLKFLEVSYTWKVELNKMNLISNEKFMHHLKNHGAEILHAKKRIKEIHLEQQEIHVKAKRYSSLFNTNSKDLALMGINETMVTCFKNQYKQRHNTLKKALIEVQDTYGIHVTNGKKEDIKRMVAEEERLKELKQKL